MGGMDGGMDLGSWATHKINQLWMIQTCHTTASKTTINCDIHIVGIWIGLEWDLEGISGIVSIWKGFFNRRWTFSVQYWPRFSACFGVNEVVLKGKQQNWQYGTVATIIGMHFSAWFGCRRSNWEPEERRKSLVGIGWENCDFLIEMAWRDAPILNKITMISSSGQDAN